jgi:hypothetical protein
MVNRDRERGRVRGRGNPPSPARASRGGHHCPRPSTLAMAVEAVHKTSESEGDEL